METYASPPPFPSTHEIATRTSTTASTPATPIQDDKNRDTCDSCGQGGMLLCCDNCPASFHFGCVNPPLDPATLPDGEWYCNRCLSNMKPPPDPPQSILAPLLARLPYLNPKAFSLPEAMIKHAKDQRNDVLNGMLHYVDMELNKSSGKAVMPNGTNEHTASDDEDFSILHSHNDEDSFNINGVTKSNKRRRITEGSSGPFHRNNEDMFIYGTDTWSSSSENSDTDRTQQPNARFVVNFTDFQNRILSDQYNYPNSPSHVPSAPEATIETPSGPTAKSNSGSISSASSNISASTTTTTTSSTSASTSSNPPSTNGAPNNNKRGRKKKDYPSTPVTPVTPATSTAAPVPSAINAPLPTTSTVNGTTSTNSNATLPTIPPQAFINGSASNRNAATAAMQFYQYNPYGGFSTVARAALGSSSTTQNPHIDPTAAQMITMQQALLAQAMPSPLIPPSSSNATNVSALSFYTTNDLNNQFTPLFIQFLAWQRLVQINQQIQLQYQQGLRFPAPVPNQSMGTTPLQRDKTQGGNGVSSTTMSSNTNTNTNTSNNNNNNNNSPSTSQPNVQSLQPQAATLQQTLQTTPLDKNDTLLHKRWSLRDKKKHAAAVAAALASTSNTTTSTSTTNNRQNEGASSSDNSILLFDEDFTLTTFPKPIALLKSDKITFEMNRKLIWIGKSGIKHKSHPTKWYKALDLDLRTIFPQADIQLVSHKHACIFYDDIRKQFVLMNYSKNYTKVNGTLYDEKSAILKDGAQIEFCSNVVFHFYTVTA